MSAAEEQSLALAGTSADEVDVAAVFERLREEVRLASTGRAPNGSVAAAARATAESSWSVSFDRRVERRPGFRGYGAWLVKAAVRKLVRWYVEPFAADQRTFNDATLKLVYDLSERLEREATTAQAARDAPERLTRGPDQRLTRAERAGRG